MLNQGPELATLLQTKLTLVVAMESGHNPIKASGLMFAYVGGICTRTRTDQAQAWTLNAVSRPHHDPWASSNASLSTTTEPPRTSGGSTKLSSDVLARDPLDS
jgi:hypothetical protein